MATSLTFTRTLCANNTLYSSRQCFKKLGFQINRVTRLYRPKSALERYNGLSKKKKLHIRPCRLQAAMDASFGGQMGHQPVFPRLNVWDPYKRLGVGRDASEEEILEARNFLIEEYAGHESSVESIEAAFETIMMTSFRVRKKSKINLKSKLKKKVDESPPWVKSIVDSVEIPEKKVIQSRAALFLIIGIWSIFRSAEGGPAFQVAVALVACIYLLNTKLKSIGRACAIGFGSFVIGWFCGSLLVPLIPSFLLPATWPPELLTSLISYIFLFMGCTFLK
ncbi:hypothetical protein SUGI_0888100 [Cryptomeria japonica]|uniref:protein CHAPERONE-LIKE PROTEIN OF POR1, chloroplastic n=1 Tax=Cryptomeria japonica TaxID=3369 RepID=UPI002414B706|nr:protein CHAPERONE-LIKE PROTEIN OF POR1, chloroplastic [Cryptomeria japonica]GLJ42844.1 hypothetical protein SUGI_0888100 [Cryptomeria japonica]